jgi:RimJ/RimL family protein N-acetyltransferase
MAGTTRKVIPSKEGLLKSLPITAGDWTICAWTREDVEALATWPKYPFPYEGFEFSFRSMNPAARDAYFSQKQRNPNILPLVVNHAHEPAIGYLSLLEINWERGRVGNFGLRIHPDWVDKGVGTAVLWRVCFWSFECGMTSIGVDVAASNPRAVRCYRKVGFNLVGETWREARDLEGVDLTAPGYDFLRPHVRQDRDIPTLRFFLMELSAESEGGHGPKSRRGFMVENNQKDG